MGKKKSRRINVFQPNKVSKTIGSAYDEGFHSIVDPNRKDYVYDEVDRYHDSIKKGVLSEAMARMRQKKVQKQNILTLGMESSDEEDKPMIHSDDDDDDDDSDETDEERKAEDDDIDEEMDDEEDEEDEGVQGFLKPSDIIEEREHKLPDERAWGKNKHLYYGTNVTDQIIKKRAKHLHIGEVHDVAMQELEAHRAYQQRMADRLQSLDTNEMLNWGDDDDGDEVKDSGAKALTETVVGTTALEVSQEDIDRLSNEEKLAMLNNLSPEFLPLTKDMTDKMQENEDLLQPVMDAFLQGKLGECMGIDYIRTKMRLNSNYVLVVAAYVMVLCSVGHAEVKTHPVMKKLAVYRSLFKKLENVDRNMIPQLKTLLYRIQKKKPLNLLHPPKPVKDVSRKSSSEASSSGTKLPRNMKKLGILSRKVSTLDVIESDEEKESKAKKVKFGGLENGIDDEDSESDNDHPLLAADAAKNTANVGDRRHIGKVITKNRGLTPNRNKKLSTPRVKYRAKYKNKVQRRKGQVREVRKEIDIYTGERTGMNPYVVKSVKLT